MAETAGAPGHVQYGPGIGHSGLPALHPGKDATGIRFIIICITDCIIAMRFFHHRNGVMKKLLRVMQTLARLAATA